MPAAAGFMWIFSHSEAGVLPAPTGPYAIGGVLFQWKNAPRHEVLPPKAGDKREVGVWVWYPAVADCDHETAPYIDHLNALAKALPSDEVSLAHAVANARLSMWPTGFPVLVFSPGSGGIPAL